MSTATYCSLQFSNSEGIHDLVLNPSSTSSRLLPQKTNLRFLSIVETARVPYNLIVGPRYDVTTTSIATEQCFSRFLLAPPYRDGNFSRRSTLWQTAVPDSPLAILVAVDAPQGSSDRPGPQITELLFFASRKSATTVGETLSPDPAQSVAADSEAQNDVQTSVCAVHALALSSDFAVLQGEPTPSSPPAGKVQAEVEAQAVFLPSHFKSTTGVDHETINEPPVRKRKSVTDTFDEAAERRRKARRKGGEGVAAAAAIQADTSVPSLKHRRSVSGSTSQPVPLQTRPLSRSPSVAFSRPTTARAPSEAPKRSSLTHMQGLPEGAEHMSLEGKNKELISRVVMAGMRLYGFVLRKTKTQRTNSAAASSVENSNDQRVDNQQQGGEYKLMYYQLYKSTCFAFRQQIRAKSLAPHIEVLRETTDRLLGIFSTDPLDTGLPALVHELTPSGRKAFGGSSKHGLGTGQSPFTIV